MALDNAVAQLLIEIAFLLPIGTNVRQHPIAAKLLKLVDAVRADATTERGAVKTTRTETVNGLRLEVPPDYDGQRNLTLAYRRGFIYGVDPAGPCPARYTAPTLQRSYERGFNEARRLKRRKDLEAL